MGNRCCSKDEDNDEMHQTGVQSSTQNYHDHFLQFDRLDKQITTQIGQFDQQNEQFIFGTPTIKESRRFNISDLTDQQKMMLQATLNYTNSQTTQMDNLESIGQAQDPSQDTISPNNIHSDKMIHESLKKILAQKLNDLTNNEGSLIRQTVQQSLLQLEKSDISADTQKNRDVTKCNRLSTSQNKDEMSFETLKESKSKSKSKKIQNSQKDITNKILNEIKKSSMTIANSEATLKQVKKGSDQSPGVRDESDEQRSLQKTLQQYLSQLEVRDQEEQTSLQKTSQHLLSQFDVRNQDKETSLQYMQQVYLSQPGSRGQDEEKSLNRTSKHHQSLLEVLDQEDKMSLIQTLQHHLSQPDVHEMDEEKSLQQTSQHHTSQHQCSQKCYWQTEIGNQTFQTLLRSFVSLLQIEDDQSLSLSCNEPQTRLPLRKRQISGRSKLTERKSYGLDEINQLEHTPSMGYNAAPSADSVASFSPGIKESWQSRARSQSPPAYTVKHERYSNKNPKDVDIKYYEGNFSSSSSSQYKQKYKKANDIASERQSKGSTVSRQQVAVIRDNNNSSLRGSVNNMSNSLQMGSIRQEIDEVNNEGSSQTNSQNDSNSIKMGSFSNSEVKSLIDSQDKQSKSETDSIYDAKSGYSRTQNSNENSQSENQLEQIRSKSHEIVEQASSVDTSIEDQQKQIGGGDCTYDQLSCIESDKSKTEDEEDDKDDQISYGSLQLQNHIVSPIEPCKMDQAKQIILSKKIGSQVTGGNNQNTYKTKSELIHQESEDQVKELTFKENVIQENNTQQLLFDDLNHTEQIEKSELTSQDYKSALEMPNNNNIEEFGTEQIELTTNQDVGIEQIENTTHMQSEIPEHQQLSEVPSDRILSHKQETMQIAYNGKQDQRYELMDALHFEILGEDHQAVQENIINVENESQIKMEDSKDTDSMEMEYNQYMDADLESELHQQVNTTVQFNLEVDKNSNKQSAANITQNELEIEEQLNQNPVYEKCNNSMEFTEDQLSVVSLPFKGSDIEKDQDIQAKSEDGGIHSNTNFLDFENVKYNPNEYPFELKNLAGPTQDISELVTGSNQQLTHKEEDLESLDIVKGQFNYGAATSSIGISIEQELIMPIIQPSEYKDVPVLESEKELPISYVINLQSSHAASAGDEVDGHTDVEKISNFDHDFDCEHERIKLDFYSQSSGSSSNQKLRHSSDDDGSLIEF